MYEEPPVTAHGRTEQRTVSVWHDFIALDAEWNDLLTDLIVVERHTQRRAAHEKTMKNHTETAFYVSTAKLPAQTYAHAIRRHWGIENRNHYVRDVTLAEDLSRIRNSPFTLAACRSIALNLCRFNKISNVADALYKNALSLQRLLNWKGIFLEN